jgi:hypothetical protein
MSSELTEMLKNKLERINPDAAAQVEEELNSYLKSTDMIQHHIDRMLLVQKVLKKYDVVAGICAETPIEIHGTPEQLMNICGELNEHVSTMDLSDEELYIEVL